MVLKDIGRFFIAILVTCGFFCGLPKLLPCIMHYVYGIAPKTDTIENLGWYGLIGDSYGIFNAFFSLLAFGGLVVTLLAQKKDKQKDAIVSKFFTMLDFQNQLLAGMHVLEIAVVKNQNGKPYYKEVTGSKAFVIYKLQIKRLLIAVRDINMKKKQNLSECDIADIAYAVFYYGASKEWKEFMMEYLKDYPAKTLLTNEILAKVKNSTRYAIGRTNQHYLSVYCRNMYKAIKLIDEASCLSDKEKKGYIKVLRAQLSNSELYVLFFNFLSRFGHKWIENDYIEKYELLQNLPLKYCDGYEPEQYFGNTTYESAGLMRSYFRGK